jgi:hypothetical protein
MMKNKLLRLSRKSGGGRPEFLENPLKMPSIFSLRRR